MTEPLQVGQFAIVDGEPVDRGPNAGVFHGKGPADDRAELFILAEGTTPAGEAFAGHVVSALGHSFAALDMSLTGSLRRLFLEAERNLVDWNRKSIAQHRVAIGLSAFGRRGDQAVIAQAGPSVAFHLRAGAVQSYMPDEQHAQPIGRGPVDPQLTRIPFGQGDRLLLISTPALRELDDELIAGILALPEDQVLPDLYRRVAHLRQVTVVLVTGPVPSKRRERAARNEESAGEYVIDATGGNAEQARAELEDASFQPSLFIEDEAESAVQSARAQLLEVGPRRTIEAVVPVMLAEAPAPLLRASGDTTAAINRMAAEGQARAARSRAAAGARTMEPPPSLAPVPSWRSPGNGHVAHAVAAPGGEPLQNTLGRGRKAHSFSRGLVHQESPPARPEHAVEDLPLASDLAATQRARSSIAAPLSETLANENGTAIAGGPPLVRPRHSMGGRWKGGGAFGGSRTAASQLPPTWMVIMGALGVLLVIAGIVTIPRMLSDDNAARAAALMTSAEQLTASAASQADNGMKREMLTQAQARLLEARDLGANAAEADVLIAQVAQVLNEMDNVRAPQSVESIASLEQFGSRPVAVSRLTIGSDTAYLLDVNSSQVIAVALNTNGARVEPRVVFSENKDEKHAKPVAIAHLEQSDSGFPTLLIADAANHLWAYSATQGLRALAFAPPGNLTINDIAVFGRDLYVLDAGQSTIYRFAQTAEGFPNTPAKAVSSPELANGRRLMVDGEFITTDQDGTVHLFLNGGVTLTFSQSGIDKPLVGPERAQSLGKDEVALLDGANDRIIVLRRDGSFERQYRDPGFQNSSAFAIRDGQAYIFSGGQLKRVIL